MVKKQKPEIKDVLIIGAGAVGLYGWYCANLVELSGYIIEAASETGGQLITPMAKHRFIRDVPCLLKITGTEIKARLYQQIKSVPSALRLIVNNLPIQLKICSSHFVVKLSKPTQNLIVKNIIITSGNGAFQPRRWEINTPFVNVFYQSPPWKQFQNKVVTVMGGGDGAINTAIELIERARVDHVNIVCKRTFLRAKPQLVSKIKTNPKVSWHLGYVLLPNRIITVGQTLKTIAVTNQTNTQIKFIKSDYYIVQYGFTMNLTAIQRWPIKFSNTQKILINQQSQTNITGIYAAGDVTYYRHKMYSLVVGFGEMANAIYNIMQNNNTVVPAYFGDQQQS